MAVVEPRGGAQARSAMAAEEKELVKGSAGLAVAWRSVRKGGANTC